MSKKHLTTLLIILLSSACKLTQPDIGDSENSTLTKVDGALLPATISDAGVSAQVESGILTAYTTRTLCDYTLQLTSGTRASGQVACLSGVATPITNGVRVHIALDGTGLPQGVHSYDFIAANLPCACPKNCPCQTNRLVPVERGLNLVPSGADGLKSYRYSLSAR